MIKDFFSNTLLLYLIILDSVLSDVHLETVYTKKPYCISYDCSLCFVIIYVVLIRYFVGWKIGQDIRQRTGAKINVGETNNWL